ncbi:HLA class II histocompatibility antigen, DO alpha chain [Cyprinus carpio]|uniref:HLA class II histocompatibility antigen, DO alpha chain n=1 Tax=Cyprinus carpio TaxID=7962 RepID=A0A9R0BCY1_CYPCA|nr:HLA class II histocompatibility antigen, DO alpha chain [Cyprinus carpio]
MKNKKFPPNTSTVPPTTKLNTKSDVKLGVENPQPSTDQNNDQPSEQDVSETQYYSNPDFSLRLFSYLNFRPERGDIYTCSVRHRGLEQDITRFWEVEVPEDSQEVETVVLVIGILVGFLGFVVGIIIIVMSKLELRAE